MPNIEFIPESIVPGFRLGRHIDHDARRAARPFAGPRLTVNNVNWPRANPILNQGDVGSCTANASVGALGTTPLYQALPANHPDLNEQEAVKLYSLEEVALGYGPYPPNDDGGTGPAIAQVVETAGFISAFNHYVTLEDSLQALMLGPVIIGINWYTSFDTPTPSGIVVIAPGATVRGGHEVVVRSVNTATSMIGFDNSWGLNAWTPDGSGFMSFATFSTLLSEQGDTTAFVPLESKADTVTVPGLEGHKVAYAKTALTALGLVPVTSAASTATVKGTTPKAETKVAVGSNVTILT
jgi:hypothetical protein